MANRDRNTLKRTLASNNETKLDAGPYEAIVVSHLDPKFMGGLEVELLKTNSSGNLPERSGQMFEVRYLNPFYGVTAGTGLSAENEGYEYSQKSYGMWFVPPDPGTRVLVIFAEGNPAQGFWIGCIQDDYMNFMIPGYASTEFTDDSTPSDLQGKKIPTSEYNKTSDSLQGKKPSVYRKPPHKPLVQQLIESGLIDDDIRGTSSSSARREVPSSVYGISTPGPADKRDGQPKQPVGPFDGKANIHVNRFGGSSLVMDDGDDKLIRKGHAKDTPYEYIDIETGSERDGDVAIPHNECFRLKTRTGHQILLHNSEDLIYISNSRGTAWIELTSNGKIDIFCEDSMSIHSSQDLNFTADRDINLTAHENLNVSAGKNMKSSAGGSNDIASGERVNIVTSTDISFSTDASLTFAAKQGVSILSEGAGISLACTEDLYLNSDSGVNVFGGETVKVASSGGLHLNSDSDMMMQSKGGRMNIKSGQDTRIESDTSIHQKASVALFQEAVGGSINIKAGENLFSETGSNFNIKSGADIKTQSGGSFNIKSEGNIFADGSEIRLNEGGSAEADAATAAIAARPAGVPNDMEIFEPAASQAADGSRSLSGSGSLMAARVPQHEPWLQHENLDPTQFTPDKTRAGMQQVDIDVESTKDTFKNIISKPTGNGGPGTSSYRYPSAASSGGAGGYNPQLETDPGGSFVPDLSTDRAKRAYEYFRGQGFTEAQAAGIVGNLQAESGIDLNPNAKGDGSDAWGIAQWNRRWSPDRVSNFQKVIGVPLRGSSFEQQLEFISAEMNGLDAGAARAKRKILALKDPENGDVHEKLKIARKSAGIFDEDFERSDGTHRQKRKNYASSFLLEALSGFNLEGNPGLVELTKSDSLGAGSEGAGIIGGPADIIDPGTGNLAMRVLEKQAGATRRLPIQPALKNMLNRAAHATDIDQVVVYSGGQPSAPNGPRTGSTRHDRGRAADFYLVRGGKKLSGASNEGRRYMAAFITAAVSYGIRAVGWSPGYMGNNNIHMDFLGDMSANRNLLVWGSGGRSANAVGWVKKAAQNGLSRGTSPE
jgi:uncharacterized protein (DUF2345 family)